MPQVNINFQIDTKLKKDYEPFYSDKNMLALQKSHEQLQTGKIISKTMNELETFE